MQKDELQKRRPLCRCPRSTPQSTIAWSSINPMSTDTKVFPISFILTPRALSHSLAYLRACVSDICMVCCVKGFWKRLLLEMQCCLQSPKLAHLTHLCLRPVRGIMPMGRAVSVSTEHATTGSRNAGSGTSGAAGTKASRLRAGDLVTPGNELTADRWFAGSGKNGFFTALSEKF